MSNKINQTKYVSPFEIITTPICKPLAAELFESYRTEEKKSIQLFILEVLKQVGINEIPYRFKVAINSTILSLYILCDTPKNKYLLFVAVGETPQEAQSVIDEFISVLEKRLELLEIEENFNINGFQLYKEE